MELTAPERAELYELCDRLGLRDGTWGDISVSATEIAHLLERGATRSAARQKTWAWAVVAICSVSSLLFGTGLAVAAESVETLGMLGLLLSAVTAMAAVLGGVTLWHRRRGRALARWESRVRVAATRYGATVFDTWIMAFRWALAHGVPPLELMRPNVPLVDSPHFVVGFCPLVGCVALLQCEPARELVQITFRLHEYLCERIALQQHLSQVANALGWTMRPLANGFALTSALGPTSDTPDIALADTVSQLVDALHRG